MIEQLQLGDRVRHPFHKIAEIVGIGTRTATIRTEAGRTLDVSLHTLTYEPDPAELDRRARFEKQISQAKYGDGAFLDGDDGL